MSADNTKVLLIAQMKRAIELLENGDVARGIYSNDLAELDNKLHEIRRDSIRYIDGLRRGRWK